MNPEKHGGIRWAVRGIGILIFAGLLYRIGPAKIWAILAGIHPGCFAAALPIFFGMIWIKTVKMKLLMIHDVNAFHLYQMNAFAFSIGSLTPGRIGEFSKIMFLSRVGVPVSESFSVTLIDRLSDVAIMLICALAGMYLFFGKIAGTTGLLVTVGAAAVAAAAWTSDRILIRVTRGKWREVIRTESEAIRAYVRNIRSGTWAATAGLTLAYMGLYFLQMWILARGLHFPITYAQTALAISCAAMPAILPISVGNVGPRDAVLAAVFSKMGWGADGGLAFSTLILALFLANGIFGLFFIPKKR